MSQQPPAGYYPTYNPYPAPQQVPVGAPGWAPPAHPQTYQGYTAPQPYPQQAQQYPQTQPQPPFNYQNPSYPAPQNTGYPPTFPQQFPGSQPWPQGAQPGQQWQQGGSQGQPPWNPAYNQQQVQPTAPQGPYPPQPSQPYPQQPVAPNNFPYNNFGQPPVRTFLGALFADTYRRRLKDIILMYQVVKDLSMQVHQRQPGKGISNQAGTSKVQPIQQQVTLNPWLNLAQLLLSRQMPKIDARPQ